MKQFNRTLILISVCIFFIGSCATTASAIRAGDLQNLRIVDHYFTCQINGRNKKDDVIVLTKNPSKSRFLVLTLKTQVNKKRIELWGNDFILRYERDGFDLRSTCKGISTIKNNGLIRAFYLDTDGSKIGTLLNSEETSFVLAFFLKNDVTEINLDRVGAKESIKYFLPQKRPYSVFVAANNTSKFMMGKIKNLLEGGGYRVFLSNALVKSKKNLCIKYVYSAEKVAREISQKLKAKFGIIGKLEVMNNLTNHDVVIWIGTEVFHEI